MNIETAMAALDDWLTKKGIRYTKAAFTGFYGEAANYSFEIGFDGWRFFELKTPPPEENDLILGISDDGEAATFSWDPDEGPCGGWMGFDRYISDLQNGSDLIDWLKTDFCTTEQREAQQADTPAVTQNE